MVDSTGIRLPIKNGYGKVAYGAVSINLSPFSRIEASFYLESPTTLAESYAFGGHIGIYDLDHKAGDEARKSHFSYNLWSGSRSITIGINVSEFSEHYFLGIESLGTGSRNGTVYCQIVKFIV